MESPRGYAGDGYNRAETTSGAERKEAIMRQRLALALLGCLTAALLVSGGCAAPAPASEEAAPEAGFAGIWEVVRLDDGERVIEGEDLERLRSLDMHIYLELAEDGRAVLRTFDEEQAGTWQADSSSTAAMVLPDGQRVGMELSDGVLLFSQGEDRLEFQRTDLAELPPAPDDALPEARDAAQEGAAGSSS